ncbi:Protein REDUCED WALL ACETYLATION 2 [Ananas comosus]|uniref:Protein REDUCED WALL ACETYLATION 2 n=1 Tax=Ananas comosus TaxID=4615 RepID=A0A199UWT3_ANACO|nr:Protein REDUCED WALL ACETYLATION 2 [Ananas comosus]
MARSLRLKLFACFAVIVIVWEVPSVFDFVWSPFAFLLVFSMVSLLFCLIYCQTNAAYNDPDVSEPYPPMHEWHFRSGLDRYIWIVGMIYAYYHPTVSREVDGETGKNQSFASNTDQIIHCHNLPTGWLRVVRVSVQARKAYVQRISPLYVMDSDHVRFNLNNTMMLYSSVHCVHCSEEHNSAIPKLYSRALWVSASRSLLLPPNTYTMLKWLGKITLETYISQYHIWMRTGGPDKQPRKDLSLIPNYPMLNFLLTTAIYITVAHRVFGLTNKLKMVFIPSGDDKHLMYNIVVAAIVSVTLYAFSLTSVDPKESGL